MQYDESNHSNESSSIYDSLLSFGSVTTSRELQRQRRGIQLCYRTSTDQYETIFVLFRLFAWFYRQRGAFDGNCADSCIDICDHEPCFNDYRIGTGGFTCTCIRQQKTLCGGNTQCTVTDDKPDKCQCLSGFDGNPLSGCNDIDECSKGLCGTQSTSCTNLSPGYSCQCKDGYAFSGVYGTG